MKFRHELIKSNEDLNFTFYTIDTEETDINKFLHYDILGQEWKRVSKHWHKHLEIIYILDGYLEVSINNLTYLLKSDQLIIINSNEIHSTYCNSCNKSILVQIPYEFVQNNVEDYKNIYFKCNPDMVDSESMISQNEIKHLLKCIRDIYQNKPKHYKLEANSLIYKLLSILVNKFSVTAFNFNEKNSVRYLERLDLIKGYVNDHYMECISLDKIADVAGLSTVYFAKFFKAYMGTTFLKYLNAIRLEHFYIGLVNSDCSIYELAEKNGFANYKVLRKLFKNTYGFCPSEIRKLILESNEKSPKS